MPLAKLTLPTALPTVRQTMAELGKAVKDAGAAARPRAGRAGPRRLEESLRPQAARRRAGRGRPARPGGAPRARPPGSATAFPAAPLATRACSRLASSSCPRGRRRRRAAACACDRSRTARAARGRARRGRPCWCWSSARPPRSTGGDARGTRATAAGAPSRVPDRARRRRRSRSRSRSSPARSPGAAASSTSTRFPETTPGGAPVVAAVGRDARAVPRVLRRGRASTRSPACSPSGWSSRAATCARAGPRRRPSSAARATAAARPPGAGARPSCSAEVKARIQRHSQEFERGAAERLQDLLGGARGQPGARGRGAAARARRAVRGGPHDQDRDAHP